jgi:hypothetical protein
VTTCTGTGCNLLMYADHRPQTASLKLYVPTLGTKSIVLRINIMTSGGRYCGSNPSRAIAYAVPEIKYTMRKPETRAFGLKKRLANIQKDLLIGRLKTRKEVT